MRSPVIYLLAALTLSGCATVEEQRFDTLFREPHVYTLTNLHGEMRRSTIYANNYQRYGFIPLCTEVKLVERAYTYLVFEVLDTGRIYTYNNHRHSGEPFIDNISRYFGKECNKAKVEQLSEIDQKGIRDGRPYYGMSRQGIIYAMGYPPAHKNPSLNANRWYYWKNRFNRLIVYFDNSGIVVKIDD